MTSGCVTLRRPLMSQRLNLSYVGRRSSLMIRKSSDPLIRRPHVQLVGRQRRLSAIFAPRPRYTGYHKNQAHRKCRGFSRASLIDEAAVRATEPVSAIATWPSVTAVFRATIGPIRQGPLGRCRTAMTNFRRVQTRFSGSTVPNSTVLCL